MIDNRKYISCPLTGNECDSNCRFYIQSKNPKPDVVCAIEAIPLQLVNICEVLTDMKDNM